MRRAPLAEAEAGMAGSWSARAWTACAVGALAAVATSSAAPTASDAAPAAAVVAAALPAGFQETVAISGLEFPEAFAFSPDGRVFVAEKSGLIKVFDTLTDPVPTA